MTLPVFLQSLAVADQFGQPTRYKTAVTVMPLFFELSARVMTFTLAANLRITSLNSSPVTSLSPVWWDWVI